MKTYSIYLAIALIPAFFLFLALEYFVSKRQNLPKRFQFGNSITNITIGLAERTFNLFLTAFFIGSFYYIYDYWRLFTIHTNWYTWIFLLPLTDLVWYWYHRLGHEINFIWAAHVVHHQSEDFNYTVAARITSIQAIIRNCFWCVLPFLGFHPDVVAVTLIIHGGYSFFTHTQMIDKMGFLEHILITPSHHRVHHASNEIYINKNYGDLFVFWDKLFGTFQAEKKAEPVVYGLTEPLQNKSFIWSHFHFYIEMYYAAKEAKGFKNKIKIIFGNPESMPYGNRSKIEQNYYSQSNKSTTLSFRLKVYLILQIALSASLLAVLIFQFIQWPWYFNILICTTIITTLILCGSLIEKRKIAFILECFRFILIAALVGIHFNTPELFLGIASAVVLLAVLLDTQRYYLKYLHNISPANS